MKKDFDPEDYENDDDFVPPEDAEEWEIPILKRLHGLMPKKVTYLPNGMKAPMPSSMESVFYEENPELFPIYMRLGRKLMKLARSLDEGAEFKCDTCRTTLSLIIFNTTDFGFGGDKTSDLFREILDRDIVVGIEPGFEPETVTITVSFPNAYRMVR